MSPQPTRRKYTILRQICTLIPSHLVSRLARKHGVDRKARTFSPWSHVVALLNAQLLHALSLNDVCESLRYHAARLFDIRGATAPSKNALSHANRQRDAAMAEELFWETLSHLTARFPGFGGRTFRGLPRRFKRTINVVDSTTIHLVAQCIDWARHRRRKAAAKLHLCLNLESFLPRVAVVDSARPRDSKKAREICANIAQGEIVIFDRAYLDFAHLADLTRRGVAWVTRTRHNMRFRVRKRLLQKAGGKILRDDLIVLTNKVTRPKHPEVLRLVRARVEVDGEWREMEFITNNRQWAASSIADLYKCRWSIEVFFKEIKQTLQLADFLGHNKNAILWQVWTALLLYVLLRFLAFANRFALGFKRLFCRLRACIWDCLAIDSLLSACGTAGAPPPLRASPHQAYLPGFEP